MRPSWVIRPKAGSSWMPGDLLGGATPSYPQLLLRQVTAAVDATVHGHKALEGRPVPDVGVVEAGVQHDHSEGQYIARVCTRQSWGDDWGMRASGTQELKSPHHSQLPPSPGP